MDLKTFLVVIGIFVSWGVGPFLAKLAATRIGTKSVFFDILGAVPVLIITSLLVSKLKNLLQADKTGIGLAWLAGAIGSLGAIGAYFLSK